MEENQVTTPVEEVPAEPTNEAAQNESTQNVVAQENAAYVPVRQAEPKQIYVPALVMGILSIVLFLPSPRIAEILGVIGICLSVAKKKEYRTTASLVCSIIGLVLTSVVYVAGFLLYSFLATMM